MTRAFNYEPVTVQKLRYVRAFVIVRFEDGRQAWLVPGRENTGAVETLERSYEKREQILVRLIGSSLFEGVAYAIRSAIVEV